MTSSEPARRPGWRSVVRTAYLAIAGVLLAAAVAARIVAPGGALAAVTTAAAVLVALPALVLLVRWLWRGLTYRVGVRLFISYVVIGLAPFAMAACFALVVGYAVVGQLAATQVRADMARARAALAAAASGAAAELAAGHSDRAQAIVGQAAAEVGSGVHCEWVLDGPAGRLDGPGSAGLPVPRWAPGGGWQGTVVDRGAAFLAAVARHGDAVAAILLPLEPDNASALVRDRWFDARFITAALPAQPHGGSVVLGTSPGGGATVTVAGHPAMQSEAERAWLAARPASGTAWQRVRVLWILLTGSPRDFSSGAEARRTLVVGLLKMAPSGAVRELFNPLDKVGRGFMQTLRVMAAFLAVLYFAAVGFAAVMILRVTSATARLTRGARTVAAGDLAHRIPVKHHDQLGDLAVSFNAMTESVAGMLATVAEKERLAREVELAREIQRSLLPPREFASGPLAAITYFRPAAEVGGDYFDLLPTGSARLLVAIGDVAGHGLPTGLLMAMVKSAVATLTGDGHRGADLLERLNRLIVTRSLPHRMVSLALAEVEGDAGRVEITSAGHPPAIVLAVDGGVEEVLLPSLPLGHPWPDRPPVRALAFPPGSRLLLYSDGLVEGRNADGDGFGYERLHALLAANHQASSDALLGAVLAALDAHLAGEPLADDLTLVLVEHRAGAGA